MVQIVGRDQSLVKRTTCRHCTSILEYIPSEVRSRYSRDYSGCSDEVREITCPGCGKDIQVR